MVIYFINSKELLESHHFSEPFKTIIKRYKKLDITWISYDSLNV